MYLVSYLTFSGHPTEDPDTSESQDPEVRGSLYRNSEKEDDQ